MPVNNPTAAHILELATNELTKLIYEGIGTALEEVDSAMYYADEEMANILGPFYKPAKTPKPAHYRQGFVPTVELLSIADFPYVSCWGQELSPLLDENGYSLNRGRMLVQAFIIADDMTWLARSSYRYAAAIKRVLSNTTLNGLCDPVTFSGNINVSPSWKRETDDLQESWFVQVILYEFFADFIDTGDEF